MNEPTKEEIIARIAEVDKKMLSPAERAEKIWSILRQQDGLTTWDCLCFCVEWLGMMSIVWPDLLNPEIKPLAIKVNNYHYFLTDQIHESERSIKFQENMNTKVDND